MRNRFTTETQAIVSLYSFTVAHCTKLCALTVRVHFTHMWNKMFHMATLWAFSAKMTGSLYTICSRSPAAGKSQNSTVQVGAAAWRKMPPISSTISQFTTRGRPEYSRLQQTRDEVEVHPPTALQTHTSSQSTQILAWLNQTKWTICGNTRKLMFTDVLHPRWWRLGHFSTNNGQNCLCL